MWGQLVVGPFPCPMLGVVQVVVAVVGDPLNRPALHRHHAARAREVLEPLLRLEGAVGELPVADKEKTAG